jgi:hypothetical protein
MATLQMNRAVNELKRIIAVRAQQDLSDAELVGRFVSGNDEAAFDVLVRRHGPMVLSLCRRVLLNQTDAEDAQVEGQILRAVERQH